MGNRESLKKRCMDFRDNIGRDRLRPMPRHLDGMVEWLVDAQAMVMQGGGNSNAAYGGGNSSAAYDDGMRDYARAPRGDFPRGGEQESMQRGGPANNDRRDYRDYEPSEAPSEA